MADQIVDVEVDEREWSRDGDHASCEFTSDEPVVTEEDAIRKGRIDTSVWYVRRMKIGEHQVSMKLRRQKGHDSRGKPLYVDTPIKKSSWRISLELDRIKVDHRAAASDLLVRRLEEIAPKARKRRPSDDLRGEGKHLVEMGFYDAHFGVLVWSEEAYGDSDLRESEEVYANAVADALDRVRGYRVDRFVLPIGNDGMHFDNLAKMTTGGTPQDAACRYERVLAAYEVAVVKAVEEMLLVAPVDLVAVAGNHDRQSTHAMSRILAAYFRNNPDVRVDTSPRPRKYYRYGRTLIGYVHGDEERIEDLSRLMPLEVPEAWAETTCHEFHAGHFHKSKKVQVVDADENKGIRTWINPSLKATDAWHFRKGYVGARRAARAYLYEFEKAFQGFFEFDARTESSHRNACRVEVLGA
jgi:hypothetical protein